MAKEKPCSPEKNREIRETVCYPVVESLKVLNPDAITGAVMLSRMLQEPPGQSVVEEEMEPIIVWVNEILIGLTAIQMCVAGISDILFDAEKGVQFRMTQQSYEGGEVSDKVMRGLEKLALSSEQAIDSLARLNPKGPLNG